MCPLPLASLVTGSRPRLCRHSRHGGTHGRVPPPRHQSRKIPTPPAHVGNIPLSQINLNKTQDIMPIGATPGAARPSESDTCHRTNPVPRDLLPLHDVREICPSALASRQQTHFQLPVLWFGHLAAALFQVKDVQRFVSLGVDQHDVDLASGVGNRARQVV